MPDETQLTELTWLDATAQAELVRGGEATPADLVEAAIARIGAVNPQLDAVIRTRFDQARAEAADAVALPDGPFRGVPILLKDIGCTVAGEPSSFGVGALRDFNYGREACSYRQPARGGRAVGGPPAAGARLECLNCRSAQPFRRDPHRPAADAPVGRR